MAGSRRAAAAAAVAAAEAAEAAAAAVVGAGALLLLTPLVLEVLEPFAIEEAPFAFCRRIRPEKTILM
jgi:hypothetical protein